MAIASRSNGIARDGAVTSYGAGLTLPVGRSRLAGSILYTNDLHPDTRDYRRRLLGRGGVISNNDLRVIDRFVRSAYQTGFRQYIRDCGVIAGQNLAAARTKLWYPIGIQDDLIGVNIVEGDYSKSTGVRGNGTNKFFRTGYVPSVQGHTLSGGHLSVWVTTNNLAGGSIDLGVLIGGVTCISGYTAFSGGARSEMYDSSTTMLVFLRSSSAGLTASNRISLNDHRLSTDGIERSLSTNTATGTIPAQEMTLLGRHRGSLTVDAFTNRGTSYYAMGRLGMPASLQTTYYNNVLNLQRGLGRA